MEHSPIEPKRFQLSREPFAKERVRGIQDAVEEIRKERPEILSLALFGSLVRGASTEESDLDMYVYIDADELRERQPDSEEDLLVDMRWDFTVERNESLQDVTMHWKQIRKDVADEYVGFVRQKIHTKLPQLRDDQLKDIYPNPISKPILDEMLDDMQASYLKYPEGVESTHIYFGRHIVEGEGAHTETEGSRVEPNHLLYAMFFLDAGGGLKQYRKYLLEKLTSMGEVGERIWADLINSTESWEQKVPFYEGTTGKHYPRTLKEALSVYGR